jgi:hypothetical protein
MAGSTGRAAARQLIFERLLWAGRDVRHKQRGMGHNNRRQDEARGRQKGDADGLGCAGADKHSRKMQASSPALREAVIGAGLSGLTCPFSMHSSFGCVAKRI